LTFNESLHIKRSIECAKKICSRIVVVDSYSTDGTGTISEELGVEFFQNKFVNQAQQFQWAIDKCNIDSEWVLRLDADETIDEELANNISQFVANDGGGNNAAIFHRKHIFLGKWVKHGGRYPLAMLRLFRHGKAHVEQRWMDEHIVLDEGTSVFLKGGFADDNLNSVSWFIDKHNKYATREMVDIKLKQLYPELESKITAATGFKIRFKRYLKQSIYMKLPYFVRPFTYFCFRYFIQFGFLDGSRGFAYHFMQGLWYRGLVDLKCLEIDRAWESCVNDVTKVEVLEEMTGYDLQRFKK